jgi:hypothetical protein
VDGTAALDDGGGLGGEMSAELSEDFELGEGEVFVLGARVPEAADGVVRPAAKSWCRRLCRASPGRFDSTSIRFVIEPPQESSHSDSVTWIVRAYSSPA